MAKGQKRKTKEAKKAKKAAAPEKNKPSGPKYMCLDDSLQAGKLGAHRPPAKLGGMR